MINVRGVCVFTFPSFVPFKTQHLTTTSRNNLGTWRQPLSTTTAPALMASASAGSLRDAGAPPVTGDAGVADKAPSNVAGAPIDTAQLDRLCEKALTADVTGRYALAAAFFRRAADEALRLHGDTFVCTYLTLQRAASLRCQSSLEGVTQDEQAALNNEARELASSCLPLIVGRMDANTMLPGRGTAVELAFFKRFESTKHRCQHAICNSLVCRWATPPLSLLLACSYLFSVCATTRTHRPLFYA